MNRLFALLFSVFLFATASAQNSKNLTKLTNKLLLNDSIINAAHIGISIYEPETNSYLYTYNAEKNFIPASNTKLFTLYAGLKYLGNNIIGAYYKISNDTIYILPTGDPTYLHSDFATHPVHDFLNNSNYKVVLLDDEKYPVPYGKGWAWDDQQEDYMPQRSSFPGCGNLLKLEWIKNNNAKPDEFQYDLAVMNADLPDFKLTKKTDTTLSENTISREAGSNHFTVTTNNKLKTFSQEIPFETFGLQSGFMILQHSLYHLASLQKNNTVNRDNFIPLFSQKTDSVFSLMMHRSDNFYAEQTLLMASNEKLGYMSDKDMIDSLLQNDLNDIPQHPRWVDGSGLSRYNLFSPNDFVYIINKTQNEFGVERLKNILPTGGTGTLKNYFITDSSFIFAKTGSLSNNYTLSGLMTTKKNKQLIFSVMLNNYQGSSKAVRRLIEGYLHEVRMRAP
ncbi:MAG: D-alanyl-D-alanine carboxypeptidase [Bacteroidota bacterium]